MLFKTSGRLGACQLVAEEIRAGRLSEAQAQVIVDAAAARPESEGQLVEFARSNSLRLLREECRRVKTSALAAIEEYKEVHRGRELKTWTGRDGATCGTPWTGRPAEAPNVAGGQRRDHQLVLVGTAGPSP